MKRLSSEEMNNGADEQPQDMAILQILLTNAAVTSSAHGHWLRALVAAQLVAQVQFDGLATWFNWVTITHRQHDVNTVAEEHRVFARAMKICQVEQQRSLCLCCHLNKLSAFKV
jgi:hypothetical protein